VDGGGGDSRGRQSRVANPGRTAFSKSCTPSSSAQQQQRQCIRRPVRQHAFYNTALGIACCSRATGSSCRCWHRRRTGGEENVPAGLGTLPTHTPLFVAMLVGTVVIIGALTSYRLCARTDRRAVGECTAIHS
jgi:K+-transporting ATPase ATPase A chain